MKTQEEKRKTMEEKKGKKGQQDPCVANVIFKASALWADAFYKSICPSVGVFVRLSVCSLLRYRLMAFLPPLPEIGCPIFLEIRNPWGKVIERSGLTFEHFCLEVV